MLPDPCPSSSRLHGGRVLEAGTVSFTCANKGDGLEAPVSSSPASQEIAVERDASGGRPIKAAQRR